MLIYWVIFLTLAMLAFARLRISNFGWWVLGSILVAFVGLRYQVGGDWGSYLDYLQRAGGVSFIEVLAYKDPGYQVLNWLVARTGAEVWLVNVVAATAFIAGLIRFVKRLPDPRLALAVAIPYMTIVMAMGYTRQAMAFGFILWGLAYLVERRILGFVVVLAVAATFHKSALILMPLAVLSNVHSRLVTAIWVGITGAFLYLLILQEHVDALWDNYVVDEYSQASDGGPIRIAMNALPAALFLLLRKRFNMSMEERALWFWVSIFSLACIPLVSWAPTAVDRVALYFMPIQLVVASSIPGFFPTRERVLPRLAVLGFYGLVLFVWLNFASHRKAWLPYQFWPIF